VDVIVSGKMEAGYCEIWNSIGGGKLIVGIPGAFQWLKF
jgi:hypothetical protein